MPTYNVLYRIDGSDSMVVTAESPDEALRIVENTLDRLYPLWRPELTVVDIVEEAD
jgi:hypothetical protein